MKRAVRVLVAGAVALSLGGCASTTPDARPTPPQAPSAAELRNAVPWTGDDLHFLERAVAAVDEPRQTSSGAGADAGDDADTDADASRPEIILGEMATLTELVVAVSFGEWEAGRRVLVDAGVVDPRAAGQLDRALVRLQGPSIAGYLNVNSRRLPAALALHWAGWERRSLGVWREPASQVSVQIPRRGGWRVRRGPAISIPVEEILINGTAQRLTEVGVGASPAEAVPMVMWVRGLSVSDLPAQVLPSELTIAVTPGPTDGDLRVHVALPFASERDAQVAMVVARLVIPRFLQEIGVERGERFDILRSESELYLVGIALTIDQLTDMLREREEQ